MPYRATILFVCAANLCRSPMAEHIMRRLIERAGDAERLAVASAGAWAESDLPAPAKAQQVMVEDGLDLSAHRSRALNQQTIDGADLILVMTQDQKQDILSRFLRAEDEIWLLSEIVGKRFDIMDPYGGSVERYRETKEGLQTLLMRGYDRLVRLALGLEKRPPKRGFRLF